MGSDDRREEKRQIDSRPAVLLALGFACLYLRTLCPTIYVGDSGEICTAIATGGVIHPPGYPLFSLLGRTAIALLPWGEPAYRIGIVVALAAALAVGTLYLLARDIGAARWAAITAAAVFGLSRTFWSQSVRVEVYSLHILLVCLTLWAALRYHHTGRTAWLVGASLTFSLGLSHHLTIVLLAPALLLLCVQRLLTSARWRKETIGLIGVVLTGPSLYLLLMLWATAEPIQAWGRPVSLSLLWNHASGHFYRNLLQLPDGAMLQKRSIESWHFFNETFPLLTGLLAPLGLWRVWRSDRRAGAALLLLPIPILLYNLCYRIDDIAPYYLTMWLTCAILLAVALTGTQEMLRPYRLDRGLAICALALLPALPMARNWESCNLSGATWVREFARHKLESAEPGSVLLTATDNDSFPVWYVRDVLKVRPDVLPLDRTILMGTWLTYERDPSLWYLHRLRREKVAVPLEIPEDAAGRQELGQDGYLIKLLEGPLRDRPLCTTFLTSGPATTYDRRLFFRWAGERYRPLPVGILVRLQPKDRPVDLRTLIQENERHWASITLPNLRGTRMDDELDADYVPDLYACALVNFGGLHELAGNHARAEAIYRLAHDWAPGYENATRALASLQAARASQRGDGKG